MNDVKSLKIALLVVIVAAIALVGVSYNGQKKAENRTMALVSAIKSADSLEQIQSSADSFLAYSGAGSSASAAVCVIDSEGYGSLYAEHGNDAGQYLGNCIPGGVSSNWWNPFSWWN